MLALKEKDILAERAPATQGSRRDLSENSPKDAHGNLWEISPKSSEKQAANTREEIAKIAGVSSNTISKTEKIEADAVPAVLAVVRTGEITINAAAKLAALPPEGQSDPRWRQAGDSRRREGHRQGRAEAGHCLPHDSPQRHYDRFNAVEKYYVRATGRISGAA